MGKKPETACIELLGGFWVWMGPRIVGEDEWRLKKAANLVKLLALAPSHRMHRERVMELLWPELGSTAAANNLRYALHVARRTLEPAPAAASRHLQLRGDWLMLYSNGPFWVDVEAFEGAAATACDTRDPVAYRAAIDMYAGDLLPGNRYERWAEDRREGLQQLYLGLLVELAGLCEERDDFESAIEALGKAVTSEPTHEKAHVGLMGIYAASGRRQEAFLQYKRLRKALSEELGDEPGKAGQRLYEEIRAGRLPAARLPTEDRTRVVPPQPPRRNLSEEEVAVHVASIPEQPLTGKPTDGLTRRQEEIVVLVTRGLSNRQIAVELGIAEYTVATHVREILKKLGFHSRARVAAWAVEHGLLP